MASSAAAATLCANDLGSQDYATEYLDRAAPGFVMTSQHHDYDGGPKCKYRPMWCSTFQNASPHSSAAQTRPRIGGSEYCPTDDLFWEQNGSFASAFLSTALFQLPPRSSYSDHGSDSDCDQEALPMIADPWAFH